MILSNSISKGTHVTCTVLVMVKGEFDALLQWLFIQRPKTDMNIASGCSRFILQNELKKGGFIVDDTIFKVKVDTTTKHPPDTSHQHP